MTDLGTIHLDSCTGRRLDMDHWQSSPCSLLWPAEGKPDILDEPLVTSPVKASSFRVKTFIKTQNLYILQFHCQ